jgi:hypothetical protein
MTIITSVIQLGPEQAPERDLGVRRSYQDPLMPGYQPQIINNNLVSEGGAGSRIKELMDQIVRIIRFGPANPSGSITSVTVVNGGSGYDSANPPQIVFSTPNSGTNRATGNAVVVGDNITQVAITNPGSGYTSIPTITILGGNASATLIANLNVVLHITVEPQI